MGTDEDAKRRVDVGILLHQMFSVLIFAVYAALWSAGVWVALRYGAVAGYVGFAWVVPLAAVLWWNYEFEMFGISPLNLPFVLSLIWGGFLLSVVCFPLLVLTEWERLSLLSFLGLMAGSFLNAIPFWVYMYLNKHPPR